MENIQQTAAPFALIVKPDRQTLRLMTRLLAALAFAIVGFVGFSAYESLVLGLSPLGEMPPLFDSFHWAKMGFSLLASWLIAWTIYSERAVAHGFDREELSAPARSAAAAILGVALGSTLLFLVDPLMFGATAQEDQSVEWLSTALLFGACGLLLAAAIRHRNKLIMAFGLLLAAVFFVMAMEEISWMQRVVGFATPQEIAKVNWQGEFNFHNVQTDLFENVFYVGSALFLILLPFIGDATPWFRSLGPASSFLPGRLVVAASAPLSIFNYGMWNVIPQQMTMMLTLFVTGFYASAASRRGDRGEYWLFASLAVAVAAGQAAFLVWGRTMPDIWDASEYKELFIAFGFAVYALEASSRIRRKAA